MYSVCGCLQSDPWSELSGASGDISTHEESHLLATALSRWVHHIYTIQSYLADLFYYFYCYLCVLDALQLSLTNTLLYINLRLISK